MHRTTTQQQLLKLHPITGPRVQLVKTDPSSLQIGTFCQNTLVVLWVCTGVSVLVLVRLAISACEYAARVRVIILHLTAPHITRIKHTNTAITHTPTPPSRHHHYFRRYSPVTTIDGIVALLVPSFFFLPSFTSFPSFLPSFLPSFTSLHFTSLHFLSFLHFFSFLLLPSVPFFLPDPPGVSF